MLRRSMALVVLGALCAVASLSAVGLARRQETKPKPLANLPEAIKDPATGEEFKPLNLVADGDPPFDPKAVEAIRPVEHPLPDEPPHEGAMIKVPYVINAPDVLTVVVLTGDSTRSLNASDERLVMPDGMIDLGRYGHLEVEGLTLDQAKEKLILYLRQYLTDLELGLFAVDANGEIVRDKAGKAVRIPPAKSTNVYIMVASYSSKIWYIWGDVSITGRFPYTGNETFLDALSYSGGFLPTADPSGIQIIRPGFNGKKTTILSLDFNAVLRGDSEQNYQLLPGDRIIVPSKVKNKE